MHLAGKAEFQLPPRLSMEEYVDFVGASSTQIDPEKAKQQKKIEKNIQVMFSLQSSNHRQLQEAIE